MDSKTKKILLALGLIALVVWWSRREEKPADTNAGGSDQGTGAGETIIESKDPSVNLSNDDSQLIPDLTPVVVNK